MYEAPDPAGTMEILVTTIIDRCYPLRDTDEAMRHLGEGHVKGKVVISLVGDEVNASA